MICGLKLGLSKTHTYSGQILTLFKCSKLWLTGKVFFYGLYQLKMGE